LSHHGILPRQASHREKPLGVLYGQMDGVRRRRRTVRLLSGRRSPTYGFRREVLHTIPPDGVEEDE